MKISPDAQLIAGMKEALADMRVGDKVYMYIPYHLAYGERDYGPIPAKSNLSFIAEMTGIE
jgi:FKBP-type peptidyl-prolyl cis-trans isomerase